LITKLIFCNNNGTALIIKGTTGGANSANKNTQHSSVHAVSPAPNISLVDLEIYMSGHSSATVEVSLQMAFLHWSLNIKLEKKK